MLAGVYWVVRGTGAGLDRSARPGPGPCLSISGLLLGPLLGFCSASASAMPRTPPRLMYMYACEDRGMDTQIISHAAGLGQLDACESGSMLQGGI